MMFIDKKDARYRQFMRQFKSLSLEDQLALINYMIFLYSEDFFLSVSLDEEIVNDEKLKSVSGSLGFGLIGSGGSAIDALKENYSLSGFKDIPSLLSLEHSA
jgi:hypothetical protein